MIFLLCVKFCGVVFFYLNVLFFFKDGDDCWKFGNFMSVWVLILKVRDF